MARKGNTNKLGHGRRVHINGKRCGCGREIGCREVRQIRHAGGRADVCIRCAGATSGMLMLVG